MGNRRNKRDIIIKVIKSNNTYDNRMAKYFAEKYYEKIKNRKK